MIHSLKAERERAITSLLHASDYLIHCQAKAVLLSLSEFQAYVILIQAAYKLGYRGPLLQFDKLR